jgi:hypothetical protein
MLAPWRAGIKRARLVKRLVVALRRKERNAAREQEPMHSPPLGAGPGGGLEWLDAADAGVGLVLGREARFDERAQNPMQRGVEQSAAADAGVGPVLGREARFDNRIQNPMLSLPPGAGPGGGLERSGAADAGVGPVLGREARFDERVQNPMQRGMERPVRSVEGPFRRGLLGSAVCNTAVTHKLVAQVERGGGWTVLMAIDAAKQAGEDWQPRVAEARQRLLDEANRRRPPCILLEPLVADFDRWGAMQGDA